MFQVRLSIYNQTKAEIYHFGHERLIYVQDYMDGFF